MIKVSLCMIVKNEEKVLGRCLDSIRKGMDEIIIVDTGSYDATKAVARKYTDKIFDFKWNDDFSSARNFSFSKATGDFILWLDADDVITEENLGRFISLKENITDGTDVYMMRYNTAFDEAGVPVFCCYRERLIRRSTPHVWKGKVHEAIEYSGRTEYSDIAVNHLSVKKEYGRRNLEIYEKQKKSGEKMTPRDCFYYGRELYYHKQFEKAEEVLSEFLKDKAGWSENKIEACRILSECFKEENDLDKAVKSLTDSFLYGIPKADICCEIGNIFFSHSEFKTAAFWFQTALSLPFEEKNGGFIRKDFENFIPCIMLCVCYDRLGDIEKAERYNIEAGKIKPYSEAYLHNLEYFKKLKETEHQDKPSEISFESKTQ